MIRPGIAAILLLTAVFGLGRWSQSQKRVIPPIQEAFNVHSQPIPAARPHQPPPTHPSKQEVVKRHQGPQRTQVAAPRQAPIINASAPGFPPAGIRSRPAFHGDLPYLNRDSQAAFRQWLPLRRNEWEQIEARVRRTVQVRDDFVTIPFPRLASTAARQIAQAVDNYKREAAIVDPRLSREVTCAFKATALSDLCDRLRADTGIQLYAGSSIADEKLTLFCEKTPLRDVMRQMSRPFGYTWLRSRKEGADYRYELVQDLRSQLLEEELRNRARNEALLALDREMQRYRPYLALSPDEALARSKTAPPPEKKLLDNLADRGWGAIQMYFRLSPRELEMLRAGQPLTLAQDPRPGDQLHPPELPLPSDLARGVLQSLRAPRIRDDRGGPDGIIIAEKLPDGVPPAAFPEARARITLKFGHSELGQFTFDADAWVYVGTRTFGAGRECATGTTSAVGDPKNAEVHSSLAHDPAFTVHITVKPQPSCRPPAPVGGNSAPPREARATSADVLEALHRATGMPVVADFYTRLFPLSHVSAQDVTLFEALNQLSDTMRFRWLREGRWLQFRSVSFYDDRLKEVPNRLLLRWAQSRSDAGGRRRHPPTAWVPGLTLDDLIEVAQLTDAQLDSDTMAEGARDCFGLVEWDLVRRGTASSTRSQLRYLATLTSPQRQMAETTAGLPFTQLSLAQQQQLIAHLGPRLQWAHIQSLESLTGAAVRVEYMQPGEFCWRPPEAVRPTGADARPSPFDRLRAGMFGLSPVRARTREAALQAARRIDPNADPTQIAPTELAVAVVYLLTDPTTGGLQPLGVRGVPGGVRLNW
jgi:hypothetical protein